MARIDSGSEDKSSKGWKLCAMPWWHKGLQDRQVIEANFSGSRSGHGGAEGVAPAAKQHSLTAIAKASLLTRRRLRLDPDRKLFFLYEPGKQVSSAVTIKNVSRSHVAFKFQTNAPKSCFMRPPYGVLAPKESIMTSVVKFVEQPEHPQERKTRDKFKIISLKVKEGTEYTSELFEEHKELAAVESVLRVVFLDPDQPSQNLEKLKKRLAEAEAITQARKKPQDDEAPKLAAPAEGVIDEWKERRERYLARQVEGEIAIVFHGNQ